MGRPSKTTPFTHVEPFGRARRTGDRLEYHIGSSYHLAKASLSRLLKQFDNNVDFVILTPYHHTKTEQENAKLFQAFPGEYRALVGTMKVGAYELAGHWQEKGGEDQIERSWFVAKRDPCLSTEAFIGAGQKLASQYEQTAIVVSRQGVVTLETPAGEVWAILTTAESIENATLKLMQATSEFNKGKRPGIGFSELRRMKDGGRDSTFVFDNAPDADQGKTSSVKPEIFVTVPVNNFGKWAFSIIGLNWPDW
jgi:hypothetical protein